MRSLTLGTRPLDVMMLDEHRAPLNCPRLPCAAHHQMWR